MLLLMQINDIIFERYFTIFVEKVLLENYLIIFLRQVCFIIKSTQASLKFLRFPQI